MTLLWWQGLILGLVQGLAEFLPVSSSGHLVLAEAALGYHSPGVTFEVMLHLATLLSVVIVYARRLTWIVRGMVIGEADSWRFAGRVVLASVPAAVAGLLFQDFFERQFDSLTVVGVDFLATALILWSTRWAPPSPAEQPVGTRSALLMGLAQVLAILPGVSRSGTTITAGLWSGSGARAAAEFSFIMAVVVIAGSGLLEARHMVGGGGLSVGEVWAFVAALVSGVAAIRLLVMLLRRGRFHLFAPYCAAVGLGTLWWSFWR